MDGLAKRWIFLCVPAIYINECSEKPSFIFHTPFLSSHTTPKSCTYLRIIFSPPLNNSMHCTVYTFRFSLLYLRNSYMVVNFPEIVETFSYSEKGLKKRKIQFHPMEKGRKLRSDVQTEDKNRRHAELEPGSPCLNSDWDLRGVFFVWEENENCGFKWIKKFSHAKKKKKGKDEEVLMFVSIKKLFTKSKNEVSEQLQTSNSVMFTK